MRRLVGVVVLAVAIGGCGTDDGGGEVDVEDSVEDSDLAPADGEALAEVSRIDDRVDVAPGDDAELVQVADERQPVELGHVVRTDASGFAEVTYFDGSLTRLDVDTEFTVVELSDAPDASLVRSRMGLGRTWQRVEELSGEDRFEVETSVAVAVVRGTAFLIECVSATECTFTVFEGSVDIEFEGETVTLDAGESLAVRGDGSAPTAIAGDLAADDWVVRNVDLDTERGFPTLDLATSDPEDPEPVDADGLQLRIEPASGPIGTVITATISGCQTGGNEARLDFAFTDSTPANSEFFVPADDGSATVEIEVLDKEGPGGPGVDAEVIVLCDDWTEAPFTVER